VLVISVLYFVSAQDCIKNSTQASCSSYVYPTESARGDITSLCSAMSFMPGCTLDRTCNTSRSDIADSPYCDEFAVVREICAFDTGMSMMKGCSGYNSMCVSGTAVMQCSLNVLTIPSTMIAKNLTLGICNEMTMDGCEKCSATGAPCDWLSVYSNLCIQMPDMSQCGAWQTMCRSIPDWPLCKADSSDSSAPVQMLMYFHTGFSDYILFKGWVPRTSWQYALSFIAVVIIAILHEFLKVGRSLLERRWEYQYIQPKLNNNCENDMTEAGCDKNSRIPPFRPLVDFPRCCLHGLEIAWGLFVMLIAMTYNVGLFIGIIFGAMVGMCLVGRYAPYNPTASSCC